MVCKGGYGTVRIVDLLDFAFKKQPKWIVGFV
jgi:muramoyltetrapeptide carboxypeptidase LdcA involved in peptidoglycan recycling